MTQREHRRAIDRPAAERRQRHLLRSPGGKSDLLVNCGNLNSVGFVMNPFLRAHGVNGLPRLALTHGDSRHVGRVTLLATLFPIEQLVTSSMRFNSPVYRAAFKEFQKTPGCGRTVNRGDEMGV